MKAKDLISTNETALVLYTHGDEFIIQENQRGATGEWKIDPQRKFDKVIIYRRDSDTGANDVFVAIPIIREKTVENRYKIYLAKIRFIGVTKLNWIEFAEGGSNPVRYL